MATEVSRAASTGHLHRRRGVLVCRPRHRASARGSGVASRRQTESRAGNGNAATIASAPCRFPRDRARSSPVCRQLRVLSRLGGSRRRNWSESAAIALSSRRPRWRDSLADYPIRSTRSGHAIAQRFDRTTGQRHRRFSAQRAYDRARSWQAPAAIRWRLSASIPDH